MNPQLQAALFILAVLAFFLLENWIIEARRRRRAARWFQISNQR